MTESIRSFTEKCIVTEDGEEKEVDVVVLGAGFKVAQYFWPVDYLGTEGMTLKKLWEKDGARSVSPFSSVLITTAKVEVQEHLLNGD